MTEQKYYSPQEVAEILSVSRATIMRRIRSGELQSVRIGRQYRVSDEDLQCWIENQRVKKN